MDVNIVVAIIGFVQTILVTILGFYIQKSLKKQQLLDDQRDLRDKRRFEEAKLSLQMQEANNQLTVGIAYALKRGRCNGEVEEGLKAMDKANKEYLKFLSDIAIDEIK